VYYNIINLRVGLDDLTRPGNSMLCAGLESPHDFSAAVINDLDIQGSQVFNKRRRRYA